MSVYDFGEEDAIERARKFAVELGHAAAVTVYRARVTAEYHVVDAWKRLPDGVGKVEWLVSATGKAVRQAHES